MANKKTIEESTVSEAAVQKNEHSFSKTQLLSSRRFRSRRDIISALLDEDKKYAVKTAEQMIEDYMKGKVK